MLDGTDIGGAGADVEDGDDRRGLSDGTDVGGAGGSGADDADVGDVGEAVESMVNIEGSLQCSLNPSESLHPGHEGVFWVMRA